ncbi:MAG: hypothetical protein ACO3GP_09965, partial [Candidatus Limnocylindrus sp.]
HPRRGFRINQHNTMTTDTPTIAQTIAGALERAAAASPQPIPVRHLIDIPATTTKDYLGARLCGLALYWLHKQQCFTIATLARAIKTHPDTINSRIKAATQLKRVEPWSTVYNSIRNSPEAD